MIKPCIFTITLFFLIVLMLVIIFKNKFEEHFNQRQRSIPEHNSRTCKHPYSNQLINGLDQDDENTNYPFPDEDVCSLSNQNLDIVDVHVNNNNDPQFRISRNIHMVNPYNPCCLRTCINDFTDVDSSDGRLRSDFLNADGSTKNLHYFFTSKCNECIQNHWSALRLLHEGQICPNS